MISLVWPTLEPFGATMCALSVLTIVVFLIFPLDIPNRSPTFRAKSITTIAKANEFLIAKLPPWFTLTLDYSTIPITVNVILCILQIIGWEDIVVAMKGNSNLVPFSIVILFFTLAYMSISLDITGVFDFIARKAVGLSNGSGARLFLIFFSLSSAITIATSNDIVILTLTPIICALTQYSQYNIKSTLALLFAQFLAANIWSMIFFIGNPTNIVVAQAFQLTFFGYTKWMAIPTIAAGLTCFAVLFVFYSQTHAIPLAVSIPQLDPYQRFHDIPGAIFGTIVFGSCIILVACSSAINIPIWIFTVIGFLLMFGKDVIKDLHFWFNVRKKTVLQLNNKFDEPNEIEMQAIRKDPEQLHTANTASLPERNGSYSPEIPKKPKETTSDLVVLKFGDEEDDGEASSGSAVTMESYRPYSFGNGIDELNDDFSNRSTNDDSMPVPSSKMESKMQTKLDDLPPQFPLTAIVLSRLPWKVLPFVVGVFVMVQCMDKTGLIGFFAALFSYAVGSGSSQGNILASVFIAGVTSSILCNIINNQPMTIMFTKILMSPYLSISEVSLKGGMFAVTIGSNLGGNMTLVGALAGIMWKKILRDKGIDLSPFQFAATGTLAMVPVLTVTLFALYGEIGSWT